MKLQTLRFSEKHRRSWGFSRSRNQAKYNNVTTEDPKANFYDRPQLSLMITLTVVLLGFSTNGFAESIKLGYAALSGAHVAAWMAKEADTFQNTASKRSSSIFPQSQLPRR